MKTFITWILGREFSFAQEGLCSSLGDKAWETSPRLLREGLFRLDVWRGN
jgi:hypothetical protein